MNKLIYQSEKMSINFIEEDKICEITLVHNEEQIEEFKDDLQKFLKIVEQIKPIKNVWNLSNFELTINLDLQEWIDTTINQKEIELGVKYEAFIMPENIINQLSIEQTMEEQHGQSIKTKYFSDSNEALEWIKYL